MGCHELCQTPVFPKPFICIPSYPRFPAVSPVHLPPLTSILCFPAHWSSGSSNEFLLCFPWGRFCPLLQSEDSLEWMPSHPRCEILEWFLPYLAPEESQSKQCPVVSSHPCYNFYGFVTKLCCSQLGCTNSPPLIRGWELLLHSMLQEIADCSEWSLNLLERGPESFGSHEVLHLASKDLN